MNFPIEYLGSAFRYFDKGERHVTRFCDFDVLLLVFDGVLKFGEDCEEYEIAAGSYHIQKAGTYQKGTHPCNAPKYFYVHFRCKYADKGMCSDGKFDIAAFMPLMEELQRLENGGGSYTEKCVIFFEMLSRLYRKDYVYTAAERMAARLGTDFAKRLSLDALAAEFGYCKNQIINIFKKEYGITPFGYLTEVRLKEAEKLLVESDKATEAIAYDCGFNDYSAFYKAFFRKHGASPTDWRKRTQANRTNH